MCVVEWKPVISCQTYSSRIFHHFFIFLGELSDSTWWTPPGSTLRPAPHPPASAPHLRWVASSPWTRAIWADPSYLRAWRPCSDPSRWWCRTSSSSWRTCSWDARMINDGLMMDLWWIYGGFMEDLWRIYDGLMMDLWRIYDGLMMDLWRINDGLMIPMDPWPLSRGRYG